MADNVYRLPGHGTPICDRNGEPCPELIERIEELLQQAMSGDLQALMYVGLYADEATTGSWVASGTLHDGMKLLGRHAMLGTEYGQMLTAAIEDN